MMLEQLLLKVTDTETASASDNQNDAEDEGDAVSSSTPLFAMQLQIDDAGIAERSENSSNDIKLSSPVNQTSPTTAPALALAPSTLSQVQMRPLPLKSLPPNEPNPSILTTLLNQNNAEHDSDAVSSSTPLFAKPTERPESTSKVSSAVNQIIQTPQTTAPAPAQSPLSEVQMKPLPLKSLQTNKPNPSKSASDNQNDTEDDGDSEAVSLSSPLFAMQLQDDDAGIAERPENATNDIKVSSSVNQTPQTTSPSPLSQTQTQSNVQPFSNQPLKFLQTNTPPNNPSIITTLLLSNTLPRIKQPLNDIHFHLFPSLQVLNLSFNNLANRDISCLNPLQLECLVSLDLSHNKITTPSSSYSSSNSSGLVALNRLIFTGKLEMLRLNNNMLFNLNFLIPQNTQPQTQSNSHLRTLWINKNNIPIHALSNLCSLSLTLKVLIYNTQTPYIPKGLVNMSGGGGGRVGDGMLDIPNEYVNFIIVGSYLYNLNQSLSQSQRQGLENLDGKQITPRSLNEAKAFSESIDGKGWINRIRGYGLNYMKYLDMESDNDNDSDGEGSSNDEFDDDDFSGFGGVKIVDVRRAFKGGVLGVGSKKKVGYENGNKRMLKRAQLHLHNIENDNDHDADIYETRSDNGMGQSGLQGFKGVRELRNNTAAAASSQIDQRDDDIMNNTPPSPTKSEPNFKRTHNNGNNNTVKNKNKNILPKSLLRNTSVKRLDEEGLIKRSISDCMDGLLPDFSNNGAAAAAGSGNENGGYEVLKVDDKSKSRFVKSKVKTVEREVVIDFTGASLPVTNNNDPATAIVSAVTALENEKPVELFYQGKSKPLVLALLSSPLSKTLTIKHPHGSTLLSLTPKYITCSYSDGSIAFNFDRYGNGNVCTSKGVGGNTILSLSAKGSKCIFFPPGKLSQSSSSSKGGKTGGEIREIQDGGRVERIKLSDTIGLDFSLPFKVVVYVKIKDLHCKVYSPPPPLSPSQAGSDGGNLMLSGCVEMLKNKGDLFGDTERIDVKRVKEEKISLDEKLSAIALAVAGL